MFAPGRTWGKLRRMTSDGALHEPGQARPREPADPLDPLTDEARLQLAKRAAGLGIHDYNIRTGVIRWDERVRELWGVAPDEPVTYDQFMAGIHQDDRAGVQSAVARALDPAGQGRYYAEYRVRSRRDGAVRWIAATGSVQFADGRPVRLVGTVQDITERIRSEELLRRNAESFRLLVDSSPFGVYIVDSRFRLARVSNGARRVFSGIEPLLGRDFAEILRIVWPEPFATEAIGQFRRTLETGEPYHAPDTTEHRGNIDAVESYDWKIERITLPDGTLGVVCHFYDATRLRQAEQSLREAHQLLGDKARHLEHLVEERTAQLRASLDRAMLAERMAVIGTFAAGLAHDMSNLLLPLSLRTDALLASSNTGDEVRRELAVIAALCDHLRQMSGNLSLFARDPRHDGVLGRTALPAWSRRVRTFLDASVGAGIFVDWDIPEDLPDAAVAPHRLTQAVQNLIHNARDAIHTRPGAPSLVPAGRIVIRARAGERGLVLSVADNGCGMTEEARRRCLEPFWTSKDAADAGPAGGTGLGLSIAHQIVERAGGGMRIESAPGAGATVTLMLPVAEPEPVALVETRPVRPSPAPPRAGPRAGARRSPGRGAP